MNVVKVRYVSGSENGLTISTGKIKKSAHLGIPNETTLKKIYFYIKLLYLYYFENLNT
jgi:hypothetical protein